MSKLDMSANDDESPDTSEEAAEKEIADLGEEAAKADSPAEDAKPKKRAAAKKSVIVEADSDFEEFSPEDLD